ncbi:MAG TPA: (d)CMP kinase [Myxococcales bacterium LLY-WYZ-16_1]|nr:(d)CMP kinase [Myxococcales bacterium LLY-WYZ-16_1]
MATIVAIDGPAGSGKSTIAKRTAERLGFVRVDTGALYRTVTLLSLEQGVDDPAGLAELAGSVCVRFTEGRVWVDGRDVTEAIRRAHVTREVSRVSAVPQVRQALLGLQRKLGRNHPRGAVMEGRDIGTVVFPDADLKVFLTATDEERARRRHRELQQTGDLTPYDDVLTDLRRRDALDSGRQVAPLRPAPDARTLDSTALSIDQVVDTIVSWARSL